MKPFNKNQLLSIAQFLKEYTKYMLTKDRIENNTYELCKSIKDNNLHEYFSEDLKQEFVNRRFINYFEYRQDIVKYVLWESKIKIDNIIMELGTHKEQQDCDEKYMSLCIEINKIYQTFFSTVDKIKVCQIQDNDTLKIAFENIVNKLNMNQALFPATTVDALPTSKDVNVSLMENDESKSQTLAFIYGDTEATVQDNMSFLLKLIEENHIPDRIVFLGGSRILTNNTDPILHKLIEPRQIIQPNIIDPLTNKHKDELTSHENNLEILETNNIKQLKVFNYKYGFVCREIHMMQYLFEVSMKERCNNVKLYKKSDCMQIVYNFNTNKYLNKQVKTKERIGNTSISTYETELGVKICYVNSPKLYKNDFYVDTRTSHSTRKSSVEDFFAYLMMTKDNIILADSLNIWNIEASPKCAIKAQKLEKTLLKLKLDIKTKVIPCGNSFDFDKADIGELLKIVAVTMDMKLKCFTNKDLNTPSSKNKL